MVYIDFGSMTDKEKFVEMFIDSKEIDEDEHLISKLESDSNHEAFQSVWLRSLNRTKDAIGTTHGDAKLRIA